MNNLELIVSRLVAKGCQLRSVPAVAMRVLELTSNPRGEVGALKDCIKNDPALTTKVLRLVNSSLFALSREVNDLEQALAMLGTKPLKMLVLLSLPELFGGVGAQSLGWYWRRTLTKAVAAREIVEQILHQGNEEAFVAGLLQDMGLLLLIQELDGPFLRFLNTAQTEGGDLIALETLAMGFNHTTLTTVLLKHWGMPETLADSLSTDPTPMPITTSSRFHGLQRILRLADLLAIALTDGSPEAFRHLMSIGKSEYQLSVRELHELIEGIDPKVLELAKAFSLQVPGKGCERGNRVKDMRDRLTELVDSAGAGNQAADSLCGEPATTAEIADRMAAEIMAISTALSQLAACPAHAPSPIVDHGPAAGGGEEAREPLDREAASADPALLGHLSTAQTACQSSQCSLSLMLVDLSRGNGLKIGRTPEASEALGRLLINACRQQGHYYAFSLPHGEAGFAVVLPDCDRHAAVGLGHWLLDRITPSDGAQASTNHVLRLNIGIATVSRVSKSFQPVELLVAADRCLHNSHVSGTALVKSIELLS